MGAVLCKDCCWHSTERFTSRDLCTHHATQVVKDADDLVTGPYSVRPRCESERKEWRERPGIFKRGVPTKCGPHGFLFEQKKDA